MRDDGIFMFGAFGSGPPTAADRKLDAALGLVTGLIDPAEGEHEGLPVALTLERLEGARAALLDLAPRAFGGQVYTSEGAAWRAVDAIIGPIEELLADKSAPRRPRLTVLPRAGGSRP